MCLQHDTTRKFFMTVEAPSTIRRGEQIGLRLCIFSTWDQDMEVLFFFVLTTTLYKLYIHIHANYQPFSQRVCVTWLPIDSLPISVSKEKV